MGSRPGSQTGLRYRNIQAVTTLLQRQGPQTQAEIARQTGLSTATVSNLIRLLVAEGSVTTERTTSNGRRATKVSARRTGMYYAGMIFTGHTTDLLITDSQNVTLDEVQLPALITEDFPARMERAFSRLTALLADNGVPPPGLRGLGIGLPASVEYPLHRESVNDLFGRQRGLPRVSVNINADLGALAHASRKTVPGARRYLYIDVSSTITAGFAIDGRTYSNTDHVVGDIGHTIVEEGGWLCQCGERGCLNTLASTRAILSQLCDLGVSAESEAAIFENGFLENPTVSRVLQRAGLASAEVVARIALFLGPEAIVIGGPFSPVAKPFIDAFRQSFQANVSSVIAARTTICHSTLANGAALKGAVILAAQEMIEDEGSN